MDGEPSNEDDTAEPEAGEPAPADSSVDEPHGPTGEDPASRRKKDEPSSRFRLIVALLIAVVSVLGAGVAWNASTTSNRASDLDQEAQQEFLLREQILTSARAVLGEDLRRVTSLQEQLTAEHVLKQQADGFRVSSPGVAKALDAQAQGDAALARTTEARFFAASPAISADGTVSYDSKAALSNLLDQYVIYQQLHPEETQEAAETAVRKYRRMVAVGVLFVAALFFLTVAEFGRRRARSIVVVLGVMATIAGCVLWPLVESGSM